ncbi:hypothetical protein Tco_0091054, partial [Tanacetum coccineum]
WRNRLEQGIAHKPVIVEVFYDLRGDYRVVHHDLCLGGPTAKGVGLRVASSHTGNHREDDFTPIETIQRFLEYGGEQSHDLLWVFLNLGHAGDWLTLSNRGGACIPKALTKPMDFRSFMVGGIDGEFHFEPKGGFAGGEGNSPSNMSVNNEAPVIDVAPLNSSPPSHVAKNVGDSNDVSLGEDIIGEAESDPDIHEFPSTNELKDSTDCHFMVAHVTPPSWKKHLRDISLEKLCDIHDRACMRQAVLDNMLNSRTRQLMTALEKARASCDVIREREFEKDKAYAELERKCNEALQDRDDLGCSFKGLILGVVVLL